MASQIVSYHQEPLEQVVLQKILLEDIYQLSKQVDWSIWVGVVQESAWCSIISPGVTSDQKKLLSEIFNTLGTSLVVEQSLKKKALFGNSDVWCFGLDVSKHQLAYFRAYRSNSDQSTWVFFPGLEDIASQANYKKAIWEYFCDYVAQ